MVKTEQMNFEVKMIESYLSKVKTLSKQENKVVKRMKDQEITKKLVCDTLATLRSGSQLVPLKNG